MTEEDFEKKLASIPLVEPDEVDLQMLTEMAADTDTTVTSLEEVIEQRACSGQILLRIPKSLHLDLAKAAKREGVSLNQYCLYKLAKGS